VPSENNIKIELIMALDNKEVTKIAHLARLDISGKSEKEVGDIANDLNKIFDWVGQMQAVNTEEISPMAHPLDTVQRLRPDEVTEIDNHKEYQELAPKVEAGLYLVPTVIE
jgi:aspartyl-tRNA(Asn)/glutamyl-tRNA(Gln) amidotransferase subunit C